MYKRTFISHSHLLVYKSKPIMLLSFLSIFVLGMPKLVQTAIILTTHRAISAYINSFTFLLFEFALIICSYLALVLIQNCTITSDTGYMGKTDLTYKNFIDFSLVFSPIILFISLQYLLQRLYLVPLFNSVFFRILFIVVPFLLFLLIPVVIFAAIYTVNNSSYPSSNPINAYRYAFRCILKLKFKIIMPFLYLLMIIILAVTVSLLSPYFFTYISVSAFYEQILKLIIISALVGILIPSYIVYIINITSDLKSNENTTGTDNKPSSKSLTLLLSIILFISCLIAIIPIRYSIEQYILYSIDNEYRTAEQYQHMKLLDLSGHHYMRCYALCGTASTYTQLLEVLTDSSRSQAELDKAYQDFDTSFTYFNNIYPYNGLSYYFSAMRYTRAGDIISGLKQLKQTNQLLPLFPNAGMKLLLSYQESLANSLASKDKVSAGNTAKDSISQDLDILNNKISILEEQLIDNSIFHSYLELDILSERQLKAFDIKVQEIALKALQNMSLSAVHYFMNGLYTEALYIGNLIEQKMPYSIVLNSIMSATDLALMQDNKQYNIAINAASRIQERFPNSKWAQKYKAEVSARAGNTQLAEEAMGILYKQYPTDFDVAEQYAYMLMIKNPGATIVDSDIKALKILDSILEKSSSRWFAYYCKAIINLKSSEYDSSLEMMTKFTNILQNDKKALPYYDQLVYIYALKYKDYMPMQPPRTALEKYSVNNPVLFNYISGSYAWLAKDYTNAFNSFKYIIESAPDLSKPRYMMGNVLFERGAPTNSINDFKKAEKEYKKALAINNNDSHCWFCLGHLYKRMDMKLEALKAFKKTIILMPEEDHAKDSWGISIHAKMEIEELQKKLEKVVK